MPDSYLLDLSKTSEARIELLCLHHAGGAPTTFRQWPEHLGRNVKVSAFGLPGRGRRFGQSMHQSMDAAADEVAAALQASRQSLPLVIFGHSMGALLAFEVCRRIEAAHAPARVIVSGAVPTRSPARSRHKWEDARLRDMMVEMGGTPPEILENEAMMAFAIPILRADLQLVDTYDPRGRDPIDTPIVAIGGDDDPALNNSKLDEWGRYSTSSFESRYFEGGHFYLEDNPHFLDWLQEHLQSLDR